MDKTTKQVPDLATRAGIEDAEVWLSESNPSCEEMQQAIDSQQEPDEGLINGLTTRELEDAFGVTVYTDPWLGEYTDDFVDACDRFNVAWRARVQEVLNDRNAE